MIHRPMTLIGLSLLLSACASSEPPRRGGAPGGATDQLRGAQVAMPMALALTGMAADDAGLIDMADITDAAERMFVRFDTDGSGGLSPMEHARWANDILGDSYARPGLRRMDSDGDGQVNQPEFVAVFARAAERYDKDGSGSLSRAELLMQIPEGRSAQPSRDQMRRMMQQRGRMPQLGSE